MMYIKTMDWTILHHHGIVQAVAKRIYVTGHRGLVGAAVVRRLIAGHGLPDLEKICLPSPQDGAGPDLRVSPYAEMTFRSHSADAVILAAGVVGGIGANVARPVEFLRDNLLIGINVVSGAHAAGIDKLVNLGSSCIYPRNAPQPLRESSLLTGTLESTNEAYAIAKIAVIKLCQYYRREYGRHYVSVMPTNLYGPGDRYDTESSHVIPTLIMKFEEARLHGGPVRLWGTGAPLREFLHVDDLADAIAVVLERYDDDELINVGSGDEISILDLASTVASIVGYDGPVEWDSSRPDGTPRKLLDSSKIRALGWTPKVNLKIGIESAVRDYRNRAHLPEKS